MALLTLETLPVVVLVQPQMPENIGATARAMANFGFNRLRLVQPREGAPAGRAFAMAAGADDILTNAQLFDSLGAALHDCNFAAAFTARARDLTQTVHTPFTLPQALAPQSALVFGGERSGLSTDDVALCHAVVHVPTVPHFQSLNLAQCVLLACAQVYAHVQNSPQQPVAVPSDIATHTDVLGLVSHLEEKLDAAGYFFPVHKKPMMMRTLHTMMVRARFTTQEVRTLRGVVRALADGYTAKKQRNASLDT